MTSLLSFMFVLGILVFIHELGHFLIAKKVGIRVERFSLGFPPYLFQKKRGDTVYCLGIIPLGGFVKMAGEQPEDGTTGAPDEFMSKTVGQRTAVILAGPLMNYILAIVIMIGLLLVVDQPVFDDERSVIGTVLKDSPAEAAGLKPGDQVIAIDGTVVTDFESMRDLVKVRVSEEIEVTWLRQNDTLTAAITTQLRTQPNISGGQDSIGVVGVIQQVKEYRSIGFGESVTTGVAAAHEMVVRTLTFVKMLLLGEASPKMLGGPLFIARQSGREAEKGASSLFFFMALLSINLAVLNILPIPVLDGGHLVFLLIEKIRRRPVTIKVRMIAQQVGFVVLMGLILMVTYNDIVRLIKGI